MGYNCLVMRIHGVTTITSFKGVSNKNEARLMLLIYICMHSYSQMGLRHLPAKALPAVNL